MTDKKTNKLSDFRPQERNSNKHTPRGMGMLETALGEGGWIGAITSAADGEVFDGSARLETAFNLLDTEPIIVDTDGTRPVILRRTDIASAKDPRAVQLGILANQVANANLAHDPNVLLEANDEGAIALSRFFTAGELEMLFASQEPEEMPGEDNEETAADELEAAEKGGIESRVSPGDIWQLGRHKMACIDSTDRGAIALLFDNLKADCIWTDPPYGVSYEGKTADKLKIQNDSLDGVDFDEFLDRTFEAIADVAAPGAPIYVAHPAGPLQISHS